MPSTHKNIMLDPYPVPAFTVPSQATVSIPGSKSITNRALLLAALAQGNTRLENCLFSRDTEVMVNALNKLGIASISEPSSKRIEVQGAGGNIPNRKAAINVGNSGTSARFLTAMLAACPDGDFILDGDGAMRKRPIQKLADTLASLGCQIDTTNGYFPIRIRPTGLAGGLAEVDATESSQFVSALLMAAPMAKEPLEVRLSNPSIRRGYIDMSLAMMEQFGVPAGNLETRLDRYRISPHAYHAPPDAYSVEGDASAASYFIALPFAVGGSIAIEGVSKNPLQGDIAFADLAASSGAHLHWGSNGLTVSLPENVSPLQFSPLGSDYYAFSDTFMTGAALAPLANGPTIIEGIGHTRHQECDRITAMADGLSQIGQSTQDTESTLTVEPRPLQTATIETYEDHRIAMSFAILGSHDALKSGQSWMKIKDPLCCRKTFPDFFEVLESARQQSLES